MRAQRLALGLGIGAVLVGLAAPCLLVAAEPLRREKVLVGKELFFREWVPGDPRARGGDGLGPVYNASSCIACHFLGGPGGAGPNERNAEIATASVRLEKDEDPAKVPREELIKAHPGFRNASGVVLHTKGVGGTYDSWRESLLRNEHGRFTLTLTQRNTPALFGTGLIDSIPETEIQRMTRRSHPEAPEVQGRVSLLPGGKIGRFGWKGQTASLDDFVRTACAVELGLEVPGHPQSPVPDDFEAKAPGLDLSDAECSALVAFVESLHAPGLRPPFNASQATAEVEGSQIFHSVGCASCHTPSVGDVQGLYSDLLLHDLGPGLVDSGVYYGSPAPAPTNLAARTSISKGDPASAQEWRTPPLWGLRDSGPHLHDGRAATEAQATVARYKKLEPAERKRIDAFLNSLAAPRPEKEVKPGKEARPTWSIRPEPIGRGSITRR